MAEVLDMTTAIDFTENYEGQSPTMQVYRHAYRLRSAARRRRRATIDLRLPGNGAEEGRARRALHVSHAERGRHFLADRACHGQAGRGRAERAHLEPHRCRRRCVPPGGLFTGVPLAGSAFNARLRDLARFGEVMRLGGAWNGQQIVPAAVVTDIRRGASREAFAKAGYATLPGWSYHHFWWVSHDDHGAFTARGITGRRSMSIPKPRW